MDQRCHYIKNSDDSFNLTLIIRSMKIIRANQPSIIKLVILVEGGLLLVSYFTIWWFDLSLFPYASLGLSGLVYGLLATVPMLIALYLMMKYPLGPLKKIQELMDTYLLQMFANTSIGQLAFISLIAGFCEEIAFRGVLHLGLSKLIPTGFAVAISAILFGLAHMITATYALIAGLIGLYFSIILIYTNNLMIVIIAHAVYDFLALLYLTRRQTENDVESI